MHQGFRETIYHPKFKGGLTPLMFASQAGNVESARILLAAGADVNEGTEEVGPPLLLAASNGREQVALLLLEKGTDPNATDGYGMTALHWAAFQDDHTLAQLLLEAEADVAAATRVGAITPLSLAASIPSAPMMRFPTSRL